MNTSDNQPPIVTVILPFVEVDNELTECVCALVNSVGGLPIELMLIHNSKQPLNRTVHQNLQDKALPLKLRILEYSEKQGPSQSWCFGLRNAKSKFVTFLAKDVQVENAWANTLLNSIGDQTNAIQGNYAGSVHSSKLLTRAETIVDRCRFYRYRSLDFRNFTIRRITALSILDKYFKGIFFSDVELDLLKGHVPELHDICFNSSSSVNNHYPTSVRSALKRKFAHGVCVGRIVVRHDLSYLGRSCMYPVKVWKGFTFQVLFWARALKYSRNFKEKIVFTFLHLFFLLGFLLGTLLPRPFIRRYYTMHFDDPSFSFKGVQNV